ncbi:acyl-CoA thioesterase [Bermanella marisrubri]|uniref:Thioesterase superfamily protein n=1 Tax=Bermanella marisrubri TaxID=207949 RepID=Q1N364_9GAMM|nr:acyl-CoA thioesterase [Bermanella marisrubri]EAT12727.1 Thioesterase superfamily protein [Oceanobacter sp. RED65] [Bermanella marisrubri]QIZ85154.1 acyl-CoA thioesterase [Bermanella marisrubri]
MGQIIQTEMTELVTPSMANFSGNMHGGELLKLLDKVAYTCAMRFSGHYAVTLSVDNVLFKQPIHIGEMVTCLATVNYTGRSSMEIGIKVIAENIKQKTVRHTHSCFFTMVAMDNGKPTPVPPLEITDDIQRRRWNKAVKRKEARFKLQEMMKAIENEDDEAFEAAAR